MRMSSRLVCSCVVLVLLALVAPAAAAAAGDTATLRPLVDSYDNLADVILGAKKAEWSLVHSILAATYGHAEATFRAASAKLAAGQDARAEIEDLASLVGQLGNEGDAAVAAVRKRLIDGGHHHHADGEEKGIYDTGFVIVTRTARKALLDAATRIGRLAGTNDATALEREWATVVKEFKALHPEK